MNAKECLKNVNDAIVELTELAGEPLPPNYDRYHKSGYTRRYTLRIGKVYSEFGIFDWWNEYLSVTQLKEMKMFLETAIALGFIGYVCFKVGAAGCSHGMWAYKDDSTTGYSPKDSDAIFHSFRNGDNYWHACIDGAWTTRDMTKTELKKYLA